MSTRTFRLTIKIYLNCYYNCRLRHCALHAEAYVWTIHTPHQLHAFLVSKTLWLRPWDRKILSMQKWKAIAHTRAQIRLLEQYCYEFYRLAYQLEAALIFPLGHFSPKVRIKLHICTHAGVYVRRYVCICVYMYVWMSVRKYVCCFNEKNV